MDKWFNIPVRTRTGLLREYMSQGHSYSHSRRELEGSLAKYQQGGEVSSFPDWDKVKADLDAGNKPKFEKGGEVVGNEIQVQPTIKEEPRKFNNIVEKQQYWDSLITKYGDQVKGRQVYMDLYTAPITVEAHEGYVYDLSDLYTENASTPEMPESLVGIKRDFLKSHRNYTHFDSYLRGYYSPEELEDLTPLERENLQKEVASQRDSFTEQFYDHPDNNYAIPEITTTWKEELERREDIENKPLFVASLFDEGGDKFTSQTQNRIEGFWNFGLDTIFDRADSLIKKGYLSEDFKKRMIPRYVMNEKGDMVGSADFRNLQDVITAKVAIFNYSRDYIRKISESKNIELTPEALDYFTIAAYNAGEGNASKMLEKFRKENLLENNAFLNTELDSYKDIHRNVIRRMRSAEMLKGEGIIQ